MFVPKKLFLTKGVGRHKKKLASFEAALRDAGIEACNLVRVTSIFPPACKIISREQGVKSMQPGQILFIVLADNATNEPNRLIASSIGVARPKDPQTFGYLSEHHSYGEKAEKAGDFAEDLAAEMLATSLGLDFDPDLSWKENEQVFELSGKIVKTHSVTQTATGHKDGLWTTVVAAAVLLDE
ncbi:MAG: pyruvoyl-dependent arginine decarboxylase [Planctomycetota bacterium]|jgi:arginine decarboxylase